jgi:hypothetical protein
MKKPTALESTAGNPSHNVSKIQRVQKFQQSRRTLNRFKTTVIYAYCHGLIPASVTTWIIQGGGLRHE